MPLTDSDIIYSKMFAAAQDDNERKLLGEKWKYLIELTNELENEKIISLNGLLNQKMYLYRSINKDTINDRGNIDVTTPGLRRYYTDLNPSLIKRPIENFIKKYDVKKLTIRSLDNINEEDISNNDDYLSLMHYNLDLIKKETYK